MSPYIHNKMPRSRESIEGEISAVKCEINTTEKDINNVNWEILGVQAKGRAATAICTSPNFSDEQTCVARQQRSEFLRQEVELELKLEKLKMDLLMKNGKIACLERELTSAN
ncbi:unnamed protein product [Fusarium fujikuroi]|uniref:Uncharacterized protein n=1 Tax=Fusarium fujikuroi TaxID=5127 RepID=A0A9Q9S0U6_FUSFU|nr:unnamed protein product [Fusarium fujikuroi]